MKLPESNPTSLNLDGAAEQCPLDIYLHGVDQTRCILGTILMTYSKENEITVVVNVRSSNQGIEKFEILFKTSNNVSSSTLTLVPHDEFRLSLYGAELEKLAQIPKISTLAFRLVYTEGVLIEWKHRGSEEMFKLNTWICTLVMFLCCFFYSFLIVQLLVFTLAEKDEVSNPDNVWYGTPNATILQSKRKQDEDEASPHEETRPQRDKEEQKRRRIEAKEAKRQKKSKPMIVEEKMDVSEPEAPHAVVSVQNHAPKTPDSPSSPPTTTSRTSHEEQLSERSVDMQAGFWADGVSM
jgi:phage terminase large subunit-like protein